MSSKTVDALLNASFASLEESKKPLPQDKSNLIPDSHGCVYEIRSLTGNTLDIVSSKEQAETIAKQCYHEYEIWQIYSGSSSRKLVTRFERRKFQNDVLRDQLNKKGLA